MAFTSFKINSEDLKVALKDLCEVFRLIAFVFLIPIPVSVYVVWSDRLLEALTPGAVINLGLGIFLRSFIFLAPAAVSYGVYRIIKEFKTTESFKAKHVMLSVSFGWLVISLIGVLPFLLSNTLSPLDSWFESMSGWSTTGLSMIKDVDSTAKDLLLYRSLTQWVGGVGIIVMALAVFFRKGTIASTYYSSERGEVRIRPSIKGTVTETWKIYGVYTIACVVLLNLAGMTLFDAVNHSMVTLATGGFSTHNSSIAYFSEKPLVEIITILFMLIGSISFLIHFKLFEGNIRTLLNNIEFRFMIVLLFLSTILISPTLYIADQFTRPADFADAFFQSVSALSCTGLSTVDLSTWPELPQLILILLMYFGGIYGSTAGGIKLLRLAVMLKIIAYSMKKLTLPRTAILRIKLGGAAIEGSEIISAFGLTAAYLLVAMVGALVLMIVDFSMMQSIFISFSSMSNVGLSNIPADTWYGMSAISKITIILLMWIGRLEIFPVLILLKSIFVKKRTRLS